MPQDNSFGTIAVFAYVNFATKKPHSQCFFNDVFFEFDGTVIELDSERIVPVSLVTRKSLFLDLEVLKSRKQCLSIPKRFVLIVLGGEVIYF